MGVLSSIKEKLFKPKPTVTAATAAAKGVVAASSNTIEPGDVEAILEAAVKAKGKKLNWRVSIVDLMTALDLDSSLAARKELAAELKYNGKDADGSAEKNTWLHKALMKKLAESGGKVPKELLDK